MIPEKFGPSILPPLLNEVFGKRKDLTRLGECLYRLEDNYQCRPLGNRIAMVLTGPTAAGKDTVRDRLSPDLCFPFTTCTTRPVRQSELINDPYHRLSEAEFLTVKERDGFFETNFYSGNWYGGRLADVTDIYNRGLVPVFRPDTQGAANYLAMARQGLPPFNDIELLVVFLLPPTWQVLEKRLYERDVLPFINTDNLDVEISRYQDRLIIARKEISWACQAHYIVVNEQDNIHKAVAAVEKILSLFA